MKMLSFALKLSMQILCLALLVHTQSAAAESSGSRFNAQRLEALMNEIVAVQSSSPRLIPRCGVVSQGNQNFCPVIARCSEAKPFCVSRSKRLRNGRTQLSCACSATSSSGISVGKDSNLVCAAVYAPVCGENGKTYGNECEAKAAQTNIAHTGACDAKASAPRVENPTMCAMIYAPVCGVDGKTYSSDCVANSKGVAVASQGECGK